MNRREFMTVLGRAAAWPLAAHGQQSARMRVVGVLIPFAADGPDSQNRVAAFLDGLQRLGWNEGQNVRIEYRWSAADAELARKYATELVALAPDVILASGASVVGPLLQLTRIIPVVFTQVPDPVGAGFVASMARPGGNATGFTQFEFGLSAKWLELLREIAPQVTRVGIVREVEGQVGVAQWAVIGAAASPLGVELSPITVHADGESERAVAEFARHSSDGLS